MASIEGIFSIRLVIADFYMEKPIHGLDPCYSDFRGKEIKKVPIIRVFGSNSNGQKTCMHVHGVFPYFYIPYEKKEFDSLNKAIYQISTNLDKAINISLGQASSAAQHVFKIQLVKGIPFYGYHRSEHQFLKIYMFNPRFIRRAANLLQNGAIMSKNFNPHESHVPYILQFMIDYNLYGMSFIHIPLEVVKFRKNDNQDAIPVADVQPAQIINPTIVKKQAISALEVDVSSNFILNRFQLLSKSEHSSNHSNPGIESIWHDEKMRRHKLALNFADDEAKLNAIPALEIPATQERPNVRPTESEVFYRTALINKLLAMETSMSMTSQSLVDQSINVSLESNVTIAMMNPFNISAKEQKRTFNLKKLLANAVYPEECTQNDKLINASYIENHLSNSSFHQNSSHSIVGLQNTPQDESIFMDDTIVDEDLVLSLTQPVQHVPLTTSLREEDMELLDVLQQLEEQNESRDHIDLDSTLAPLSQQHKKFELTPELLDKEVVAAKLNQYVYDNNSDSDEDDGNGNGHLNDFSVCVDDIDELLLKLTQSQPTQSKSTRELDQLPQIDGSDDLLQTPTKKIQLGKQTPPTTPKSRSASTKGGSPKRSPRTPKSNVAARYAPLPLIITSRSVKKSVTSTANNVTPTRVKTRLSLEFENLKNCNGCLRKKLAITEMRRKSICVTNEQPCPSNSDTTTGSIKTPQRHSKKATITDLDKTHITCSLAPSRRKSERLLKVYKTNNELQENEEKTSELISKSNKEIPLNPIKKNVSLKEIGIRKSTRNRSVMEEVKSKENQKDELRKLDQSNEKCKKVQHSKDKPEKVVTENVTGAREKTPTDTLAVNDDISLENVNKSSCNEANIDFDDDEQIPETDDEDANKSLSVHKTPNLKRLRRSFRVLAKRKSSTFQVVQNTENYVNSSKFENTSCETKSSKTPTIDDYDKSDGDDDDVAMQSFYEKSFTINSPSIFSDDVPSPACAKPKSPLASTSPVTNMYKSNSLPHISLPTSSSSTTSAAEPTVLLTPMDLPPTYEEALEGCRKFNIYEYEFQRPHYSNPNDITKKKEVGHTVLHIPGNKLNDCPQFESLLGAEAKGLIDWRQNKLLQLGGALMLNRYRNAQRMREYFASQKCIKITPQPNPPSRQEAKKWLKARELLKAKNEPEENEIDTTKNIDSPIRIRRQKVTMMLNDGVGSGDDDMDCSTLSLTLTPLTPAGALKSSLDTNVNQQNTTPLSRLSSKDLPTETKTLERLQRRHSRRAKISLSDKLKAAVDTENEVMQEEPKLKCVQLDRLLESGDSNSNSTNSAQIENAQRLESNNTSVSSQTVLAEMERSSFMKNLQSGRLEQHEVSFGLSAATLNNTFGFKVNLENLQEAKSDIEYNYLTIINLEVFVPTRAELYPNPEFDAIHCLFYAIENSVPTETTSENERTKLPIKACGYIMVNDRSDVVNEGKIHGIDSDIELKMVHTEIEAIEALLELCATWDADIYAGYEIEMGSWGYVIERAKYLCLNIAPLLSRVPSQKVRDFVDEDRDQFTEMDIEMKLCGRILLDVWRLMRSEIALTSYTFENIMYHIMHKRCPSHSYRDLTTWFASPCTRWIVIEYYLERVRGTLLLLQQLDLIGRTSEMAKLIGIQFYEVLSRGSQFRVESMMLRIAKPKNLVPLSPSVQQRAHMRAPEYLSLILEPQSRFYSDPVIVLDFQSLYPSLIIGYNYCFSTCLGRVEHLGQTTPFEFAAAQLRVSPTMLRQLIDQDLITISPCGVVFVKATVREGILPRMLTEILDTRQMVKQSMKLHKNNSALQRILHSRQLGLKLMANVTYGYTAANFSGRMPAVEVGDSVVSKGRETLERAIKLVQNNDKWNVKVVYGDTDSMFVLAPGRSREQAFKIGEEIVEAVTNDNPHPVKLKLEKVYQPCILQTKKRYVGYMYETPNQTEPVYEAKGIETVRRDGCPAAAKMLEKVLRILFETADVSQVKQYVCRQFTKLLSGRANIQDLIFAKEFRGLNGYKPTACVPALELTRKWLQTDPRRIPRCGERVPFIITNGPPGVPLIRLIRSPHEMLADEGLKINAIYYITKAIIPPLNRCLLLIGADVNEWFTNLPRKLLLTPALSTADVVIEHTKLNQAKKSTISQYFSTTNCIIDCGRQTKQGICSECSRNSRKVFVKLEDKIAKIERAFYLTQQICQACCGRVGDIKCNSLDCPVLYVLEVKHRELKQIPHFRKMLEEWF